MAGLPPHAASATTNNMQRGDSWIRRMDHDTNEVRVSDFSSSVLTFDRNRYGIGLVCCPGMHWSMFALNPDHSLMVKELALVWMRGEAAPRWDLDPWLRVLARYAGRARQLPQRCVMRVGSDCLEGAETDRWPVATSLGFLTM